jgi:hypothetical protein
VLFRSEKLLAEIGARLQPGEEILAALKGYYKLRWDYHH